MGKVFGIDLGTTYSCIAYIDENGKPVVLKNAEGDLTTPSAVFFETQTDVTVGSAAKESAKMYPEQVVTFIKRSIGQSGFSLNLNGIDMKPEEISSYILKKVVKDAEDTLRMEGKLGDDEQIRDVVITCPAYFGVTERDATKAAGVIAGLNVLAIINEPTAAAITYGVTDDSQNKTVLVYDLGGGTFDITMINIKPGEIRVICTGGDHNLGGKDWDDRVLMYLAEQYQSETGTPDNILEDAETLQELSLAAERAKKLLSAKEKAPVAVNYMGERVRVELTREKFDELTEDLLTRTIDLTREMFKEAEKKGFTQNDVSEILLVGGSSKMPQVMSRVKSAFGIETKMFQDERKQAADTIAAIMKDIQDKKMYAAQTKIDQAKANGFSIDPSVASKVTAVLKEVESQLAIMRNASGDEAFTIAMKLTELIADSDELNQSLKKFPPDEVPAVSSKRVGDEITLTWKPSPSIGEITYVVVRKENTYPNGPTDGSTVTMERNLHTPTPTLLKTRSCTTPFLRFELVFIRKQLALMKPSLLSERLQI